MYSQQNYMESFSCATGDSGMKKKKKVLITSTDCPHSIDMKQHALSLQMSFSDFDAHDLHAQGVFAKDVRHSSSAIFQCEGSYSH